MTLLSALLLKHASPLREMHRNRRRRRRVGINSGRLFGTITAHDTFRPFRQTTPGADGSRQANPVWTWSRSRLINVFTDTCLHHNFLDPAVALGGWNRVPKRRSAGLRRDEGRRSLFLRHWWLVLKHSQTWQCFPELLMGRRRPYYHHLCGNSEKRRNSWVYVCICLYLYLNINNVLLSFFIIF